MVRAMIHSEKHIVPRSLLTVDAQTILQFNIATAVAQPTQQNHVREGAIVKAVWVELWYIGSSSQPVVQVSSFEKLIGGADEMTFSESQVMNDYPNKKNLLKISQGIVGDANSNPVPVFREWIPIPKGKQTQGLGDKLLVNVSGLGEMSNDLEICGLFIYKEYF